MSENNNISIIYKNLLNKCISMINNIKTIGFDMSCFENELNNVVNLDNSSRDNHVRKLNELITKLEKYDVYFKAKNFVNYIKIQKDKKLENIDINKLVNAAYCILCEIRNIYNDGEEVIIDKFFDAIYDLIKLEVIMTGKSLLFEDVKISDANYRLLDKSVRREIDKKVINGNKYSDINEKIIELNSRGLSNNYVDLDLIKMMLRFENDNNVNKVSNKYSSRLDNLIDNIKESNDNVRSLISSFNKLKNGIPSSISEYKKIEMVYIKDLYLYHYL